MSIVAVALGLTPHGSLPVVAVTVNGQGPFDFIVDTGASHLVVGADLAAQLGLDGDGELPGMGAGGQIAPAKTKLSEVRVGNAVLRDAEAGIMDLSLVSATAEMTVSGILGYPFLAGRVVTIDYPGRELRFSG
jgi:hypothetical protein